MITTTAVEQEGHVVMFAFRVSCFKVIWAWSRQVVSRLGCSAIAKRSSFFQIQSARCTWCMADEVPLADWFGCVTLMHVHAFYVCRTKSSWARLVPEIYPYSRSRKWVHVPPIHWHKGLLYNVYPMAPYSVYPSVHVCFLWSWAGDGLNSMHEFYNYTYLHILLLLAELIYI